MASVKKTVSSSPNTSHLYEPFNALCARSGAMAWRVSPAYSERSCKATKGKHRYSYSPLRHKHFQTSEDNLGLKDRVIVLLLAMLRTG